MFNVGEGFGDLTCLGEVFDLIDFREGVFLGQLACLVPDEEGAFEGAAAIGSMRVDGATCAVQCAAGLYEELSPVFFVDFETDGFQRE